MSSAENLRFEPLNGELSSFLSVSEPALRCTHGVQFYFDDRFLIQSLCAFFRAALEAGHSAIVVATKLHRDSLAAELESSGVDLTTATAQGRYVALDAAGTLARFMRDGSLDEALFRDVVGNVISCTPAAREPDSKVDVFGEMVSLLWQRGDARAALELERYWNRLAQTHSFNLLCGYPMASFDRQVHTEIFSQICGEHQLVIPAESYTTLTDEKDRMRTVARLQQTEQVVKNEAAQRSVAQAQTREAQSQNERLVSEIRDREAAEDELRRFTRRLLTARDEEQRRIASELHENTAQLLAALSLYFGVLHEEKASLNPRVASVVDSSRSVSDTLLNEIRKLSHLLYPPTLDDMGLASTLKEYVEQFTASSGARVNLQVAEDLGRFDRRLEIAVFRIIEEALAGVRSDKCSATLRLDRSPTELVVEIQRHQSGSCASTRPETRITGIQERVTEYGGSVQFISNPSETLLAVVLPLQGAGNRK